MRKLIFLLISNAIFCFCSAQKTQITGRITDSLNNPIPGVSIKEANSRNGTTSDNNGNFKLNTVPGTKLEISAIEYQPQIVAASSSLAITLSSVNSSLKEIVVTALGIRREKRQLTYSTQEVAGETVVQAKQDNVVNALAGKVSGVQISNSSGMAGSSSRITIRGNVSLLQENQPLFVVDGVPIDNSEPGAIDVFSQGVNNTALFQGSTSNRAIDIDPSIVESITVLKGGAATALYGSAAARGAIIITTKNGGKSSKPVVSVSSSLKFDNAILADYQTLYSQGLNGQYRNGSIQGIASSQSYGARVDTLKVDGKPVQTYDPRKIFFRTGKTTDNNISVNGGSDKSKYLISYSYLNNEGIIPTTSFKRNSVFGKFTNQITKNFAATVEVNYVNTVNHRTQEGNGLTNPLWSVYAAPITWNPLPETWPDGTQRLYRSLSRNNPFFVIHNTGFTSTVNRFLPVVNLVYSPAPWISITERMGMDIYTDNARYFEAATVNSGVFQSSGGVSNRLQDYRQLNNDFIISLQKNVAKDLYGSISIGGNLLTQFSDAYTQSGLELNIPGFYNISNANSFLVSDVISRYRKVGVYAQANLEYKKLLELSLTGRYDGTSALALDKQYYPYGSAGLGFIFSELMTNRRIFSFGKVRVSYSSVGNDNIPVYSTGTPYGLGSVIAINHVNFPYDPGTGPVNGARLTNVRGNPNLKNESLNEFEVGLDLKFLKNRLSFEGSYFNRESKDLLSQIPINPSSGFLNDIRNVGSIRNKGFEFLISGTPVKTKNFSWETNFNFTRIRSKVTSLGAGVDQVQLGGFNNAGVFLFKDQPYGILYGPAYERNEKGQIEVDDDGIPIATTDFKAIGNTNPDFTAGFYNTLTYKKLSLSFLFDWRKGGDVLNLDDNYMWFYGTSKVTEKYRDGGFIVPNSVYASTGKPNESPITAQDYWPAISSITESNIEDGTYIKLRTLSLAYTLNELSRKVPFKSLTISVGGNNLWIYAPHYTSGDPEASVSGGGNGQGVTNFQTPTTRSLIVGLRATF
jgi:TonB-linked SusC/RagA family outer membrane protein